MNINELVSTVKDITDNGFKVRVIIDEKSIVAIGLSLCIGIAGALILAGFVNRKPA